MLGSSIAMSRDFIAGPGSLIYASAWAAEVDSSCFWRSRRGSTAAAPMAPKAGRRRSGRYRSFRESLSAVINGLIAGAPILPNSEAAFCLTCQLGSSRFAINWLI